MTQKLLRKRPYRKPTVTAYGTVKELTRAVGAVGADDGGMGGTDKSNN